jgi:hypothetical protein
MYYLHEQLTRAQMSDRLAEARHQRRGQQLLLAKRKARRAERAALQARLALSRSL